MSEKIREMDFDEFMEACRLYGQGLLSLKKAHPNMKDEDLLKMTEVVIRAMKFMKEA